MPLTPLVLVIDADALTPSQLSGVLDDFAGLVSEVDTELSASGERTLALRITSLSYNSPARIGLVAEPRGNHPDIGAQVVRACVVGISLVEAESTRPAEFNDDALTHLRNIADATGNGVRRVQLETPVARIVPTITRQTSAHVERILPYGYSLGTVEGRLEALNIHGQPRFTVYDAVTNRAERCYFRDDRLSEVTQAIGRKVIVTGQLRRDPEGRPQQVRPVDVFRVIDDAPVSPRADVAGLFKGLGDSREYLEIIRGE